MNKRHFEARELGVKYALPKYRVVDNKGIKRVVDLEKENTTEEPDPKKIRSMFQTITFVAGDKKVAVTDKEYEEALEICNTMIKYPGVFSNTGRFKSNFKFAINGDHSNKKKQLDEYERVVLRYENPIKRIDGVLHETVIAMLIADLKCKHAEIPSDETGIAIERLMEALMWLEQK